VESKRYGRNENKMERSRRWKEEAGAVKLSERNRGRKAGDTKRKGKMNKSLREERKFTKRKQDVGSLYCSRPNLVKCVLVLL